MKILIAGDYAPINRLAPLIEKGAYDSIFSEIIPITKQMDYSIVNFESPIVSKDDSPIYKSGPHLQCTSKAVEAIKYAGFNCATLANNHIRDFGDIGLKRTISTLNQYGIDHVGAGRNLSSAAEILFHQSGEEKIAIINCCEHEFSIATNDDYGANPMILTKIYDSIIKAKSEANYVLIIVHGGHEFYQLPSPRMQDTYRFFIDVGADIIINHHQHCYSGYEFYKNKPIIYGVGNFCMDMSAISKEQLWHYGYMVVWDTTKKNDIQIVPYNQCGIELNVHVLRDNAFEKVLEELNSIILNKSLLEEATEKYYLSSAKEVQGILEPIQNKYLAALRRRHLIPSMISRKWLIKLQNYLLCESHRDKVEFYLSHRQDA